MQRHRKVTIAITDTEVDVLHRSRLRPLECDLDHLRGYVGASNPLHAGRGAQRDDIRSTPNLDDAVSAGKDDARYLHRKAVGCLVGDQRRGS